MKRIAWVLVLTSAAIAPNALGCGDKFVAFGQGIRLQRIYASAHPGAILVYLTPESPLALSANRDRLVNLLRLAGHRPQVVSTRDELRGAAATGEFDIVLTQPSEVASVRDAVKSATIVQLLWEPTREELARVECAAPVSKRNHELLMVVNDVMEQRHEGVAPVSCPRKRT